MVNSHSFTQDRLLQIGRIEHWHFWFVGRRQLINRLLHKYLPDKDKTILDLGCGTGLMFRILTREGYRVFGADLRPEGLLATHKLIPHSRLLQIDARHLPFREGAFGIVIILDILEHVDDHTLLADIWKILKPGGSVVITVPALPWLRSYRDSAAGHLRRYTRKGLFQVLSETQFQVQKILFYQCFNLPLVILTRILGRKGPKLRDFEEQYIPIINSVLTWIAKLEVSLSNIFNLPFGSSLAAVCRKK